MKKAPIPPLLWARILKFLEDGATGQIVLHVHNGDVQSGAFNEHVKEST